jgi:hypothetical protein
VYHYGFFLLLLGIEDTSGFGAWSVLVYRRGWIGVDTIQRLQSARIMNIEAFVGLPTTQKSFFFTYICHEM